MNNLLFVYNADSGLAAALFDSAHKLFSPRSYSCNLCALTYGLTGPKRQWSEFLKTLPEPPEFLHRDQFVEKYPMLKAVNFPAIFRRGVHEPELLADGLALSGLRSLDGLIELVKSTGAHKKLILK